MPSAFDLALQDAENSVKAGFNDATGRWSPHASLEGGTGTLGYGHKLTAREAREGVVYIGGQPVALQRGIDETQAQQLYQQDVQQAVGSLRASWPNFDSLPRRYREVLTNISFNVGRVSPQGWPSLNRAMQAGDDAGVRREMVTTYTRPDGTKQRLTNRATSIADAVGLQ